MRTTAHLALHAAAHLARHATITRKFADAATSLWRTAHAAQGNSHGEAQNDSHNDGPKKEADTGPGIVAPPMIQWPNIGCRGVAFVELTPAIIVVLKATAVVAGLETLQAFLAIQICDQT